MFNSALNKRSLLRCLDPSNFIDHVPMKSSWTRSNRLSAESESRRWENDGKDLSFSFHQSLTRLIRLEFLLLWLQLDESKDSFSSMIKRLKPLSTSIYLSVEIWGQVLVTTNIDSVVFLPVFDQYFSLLFVHMLRLMKNKRRKEQPHCARKQRRPKQNTSEYHRARERKVMTSEDYCLFTLTEVLTKIIFSLLFSHSFSLLFNRHCKWNFIVLLFSMRFSCKSA